jgi:CHAD domain-containing protein
MTTRVKETERKYEPVDGTRLDALPGVVGAPEEMLLDAEYHDTADFRLARRGVTLRRRTGGVDDGWHLKLPVGGDTRDEIHGGKELTKVVKGLARGEPVAPIAHIRTKRRRWQLVGDDGAVAAEVVEDDVLAQTVGESPLVKAWREVEVELVDGGEDVFAAIERDLGRPSDTPSKLWRLLEDRIPTPPKASDKITAYVRGQVAEILRQDVRVRLDDEDSVHGMRVATRRVRSVLQAYRASPWLKKELRWLQGVLAPARDLEVLRERLENEVTELPDELVLGNVRQRLTETFAPREQKARDAVLKALNSKRYFALLDRLDDLTVEPAHRKKRLRKTARRVDRAWRDGSLHDVRKAAKRTRYAAESVGRAKLARRMKKLQKRLGVHQDSVVAREELRDLGVQSHLDGDNGFTYGLLYGRALGRAERIEESLRRK